MNAKLLDVVASGDYSATLRAWNALLADAMVGEAAAAPFPVKDSAT